MKALARRALGADRFAAAATVASSALAQIRRWRRRRPRVSFDSPLRLHKFSAGPGHTFFGYHDVTPFSGDDTRLLAIHTTNRTTGPARVGWFAADDPGAGFHAAAETATWCWQQGCRLQWHPARPGALFVYNGLFDGAFGSEVRDLDGAAVRRYGRPVYAISPDGASALSLNFARLHRLRPGYGYANLADDTEPDPAPANDGLWRIDLGDGKSGLLHSLADLARLAPAPSMRGAVHYLNHLSYSPGGKRLLFFHLWRGAGARHSRICTADADGANLAVLSPHRASHFCWLDDDEVLAFTIDEHGHGGYRRFRPGHAGFARVGGDDLAVDGHPMLSPRGGPVVIDTYPDAVSERRLSLLDLATGARMPLASFFSPPWITGARRCDLHPRWNRGGDRIAVDSAHGGRRALCVVGLQR